MDFSLKNRDHSAHEIDSRSSNNERHELSLKTDVYLMVADHIFTHFYFLLDGQYFMWRLTASVPSTQCST